MMSKDTSSASNGGVSDPAALSKQSSYQNMIPPDFRPPPTRSEGNKAILIMDINIGSPDKKVIPLEIFPHQDTSAVVSDFAAKHGLNPTKQLKLIKIIE